MHTFIKYSKSHELRLDKLQTYFDTWSLKIFVITCAFITRPSGDDWYQTLFVYDKISGALGGNSYDSREAIRIQIIDLLGFGRQLVCAPIINRLFHPPVPYYYRSAVFLNDWIAKRGNEISATAPIVIPHAQNRSLAGRTVGTYAHAFESNNVRARAVY